MKRYIISTLSVLVALATLTSCEPDSVQPALITVNTNKLMTWQGEQVTYSTDGVTTADLMITVKPKDAKLEVLSSDQEKLKLEGNHFNALQTGDANIIIKSGKSKVTVKVHIDTKIVKTRNIGEVDNQKIYIPENMAELKANKSVIEEKMKELGWDNPDPNGKTFKESYVFKAPKGSKGIFDMVQYYHSPVQGTPYIKAITRFMPLKDGLIEGVGPKYLAAYGFTEHFKKDIVEEAIFLEATHHDQHNFPLLKAQIYVNKNLITLDGTECAITMDIIE